MEAFSIIRQYLDDKNKSDSPSEGAAEPKTTGQILIVDDDEISRKYIRRLIEREFKEAKIVTKDNGLEALEFILREKPSLVILDLMLPGMNGFDVLKKIRQKASLKNTKVIVVSAKSRSEDIERGFKLTADEYITKPFKPREFIARLHNCLSLIKQTKAS